MKHVNLYLKLISFFLVISFLSCKRNEGSKENVQFDIEEAGAAPLSEFVEQVRVIKLKLPENTYISTAYSAQEFSGDLFIKAGGHFSQVYVFDSLGVLKSRIGNHGNGPGEYQHLSDFVIDDKNGHVETIDKLIGKKIIYDFSGNFVKEEIHPRWEGKSIEIIDGNTIIYYGFLKRNSDYLLQGYDREMNTEVFQALPIPDNQTSFRHVVNSFSFCRFGEDLLFWYPLCNEIYSIRNQLVQVKYQVDFGKDNIPDELFQGEYKDVKEFMDVVWAEGYAHLIGGAGESQRYLFLRASKNKQFFHLLYDKKQKKSWVIEKYIDDMIFSGSSALEISDLNVILIRNNKLYIAVDANVLRDWKNKSQDVPEFLSASFPENEEIEENGNPYLLELRLKE